MVVFAFGAACVSLALCVFLGFCAFLLWGRNQILETQIRAVAEHSKQVATMASVAHESAIANVALCVHGLAALGLEVGDMEDEDAFGEEC